jgi:hypothetical protein
MSFLIETSVLGRLANLADVSYPVATAGGPGRLAQYEKYDAQVA